MSIQEYLKGIQVQELRKFVSQIEKALVGHRELVSYLKSRPAKKQQFHRSISILQSEMRLGQLDVEDLIDKRILAYVSKKEGRLTFTSKGILMLWYQILNPDDNTVHMLDDLNEVFFEKTEKLPERSLAGFEKAIIIALLGIGAISEEYPFKLTEKNQEHFRECVDLAVQFLRNLGSEFVDSTLDSIWSSKITGESPVLGLVRRLNEIEAKTESVYRKERHNGSRHYLDVVKEGNINQFNLRYLLRERVFEARRLTYKEKKKLIDTLDRIQEYNFKLFDSSPPFDTLEIRKQLRDLIEGEL